MASMGHSDLLTVNMCIGRYRLSFKDRSKFTGYLGRVLGKIYLKKVFAPLFLDEKKSSPPFLFFPNSLTQSHENESMYSWVQNKRGGRNKRGGWEILLKK